MGGTSDVMARMLADDLTKILKQPFIIENIGGAGGAIGTERASKIPADGSTLIQTGADQSTVAHGLDANHKCNLDDRFCSYFANSFGSVRAGTAALPYVKAVKLRALAITTTQRNPQYPDMPTIAESGFEGSTRNTKLNRPAAQSMLALAAIKIIAIVCLVGLLILCLAGR